MKKYSVWKEVEIYKEAVQKICSMMHDHDQSCLACGALDRVRGAKKEVKK